MRGRVAVGLGILCLLGAGCGGNGGNQEAGSSPTPSPVVESPTPSPSATASPLVVPKACTPKGSPLKISAVNVQWILPGGGSADPGGICLAAPAGSKFTITLNNDVNKQGFATPTHQLSIYRDSTATDQLFAGDVVAYGASKTYQVPALPDGVYLFRCDIHPLTMTGVLVAK